MSLPDNYFGINANQVEIGEQQGQARIFSSTSNRITAEVDLVDSNNLDVITYDQTSGTIDFHNKTVANFSGGGGGGGGDVFLANTQTFTGVNTFNANTVLTTADTGNINTVGTISATSTISGASCTVTGNLECNTGTLECNDAEITNDCTIATGNLVVTAGTALIGGNLTTNGIGNTGDISTTTQTTTSDNIIGGDCVVAGEIVGSGGLSVSGAVSLPAISTNNINTTGTISCSSTISAASLSAVAGNITCGSGDIGGLSLTTTGGQVIFKAGNARIEDDVNNDIRIQADTNADTIVCRLGGTGLDNLQLSYDPATNKSVLRLYDFGASAYYPVGGSPDDFTTLVNALQNTSLTFNGSTSGTFEGSLISTGISTLSGTTINLGTGINTAVITCMNDVADRLNINGGVVTLDATATLAKTGTTSGATDIFTATDSIIDRSISTFTPTIFTLVTTTPAAGQVQLASGITNSLQGSIQAVRFGTNGGTPVYRVSCRGRLSGFSVNNIGAGSGSINLFTLPLGYRPIQEQNILAQAHPDEKQVRIDIATSGLVSIAEGASSNLASFCNLGGIDIWAGI